MYLKMKRKFLVFVLLIIVAIFLMNAGSVHAGKVSLMMWGGAIEEEQMKRYLAAFNEEYPVWLDSSAPHR